MDVHLAELTGIALVTTVAVFSGFALLALRQPPVVGYILAGVVLGPTGFGLVTETGSIALLAELGVVMLLFLVGMELSVRAFAAAASWAVVVVIGQIAAALAISGVFGLLLGWSIELVVLLGFIVAISSTAVAVQMLSDVNELRTRVGRITIGVLIAQDVAVVPMLIVITSFGGDSGIGPVVLRLGVAMVLIFAFLWFLGSRRSKLTLPFADRITGRVDLVAMACLALCFAAASITAVAGLSAAFGAFLAGLVIAGSTLRSEAIAATHPIQSVLLVVFFLSIGLLIDLNYLAANWPTVAAFVIAVLAVKSAVNIILLRVVRQPWEYAFPAGLIMAQVGEFSFVLAATGLAAGAVAADGYRLAIAVIAISILVSPIWLVSIRRFHDVAEGGINDFRAALAEVYAGEIEEIGRGRAAAQRLARYLTRRAKAARLVASRRRRRDT